MNAQVGLCRPGDYGSDVSHLVSFLTIKTVQIVKKNSFNVNMFYSLESTQNVLYSSRRW